MKNFLLAIAFGFVLLLPQIISAQDKDDLDKYIQRLKDDHAGPIKETGFLTAGSDFLYGQGSLDAKNYSSAEWYFRDAVKKQKDNPYFNYQLAISLIRQNDENKKQQAQEYLAAAFALNPALKERYKKDLPSDTKPANQNPSTNSTSIINNGSSTNTAGGLEAYIKSIKHSRATGGAATAMSSAGLEAFYGIEYFEANEYKSAETSFYLALAKDADNPYVNYLMAVTLAAQSKNDAAKLYLQKAITKDASLKESYIKDVAEAKTKWEKLQDSREIKIPLAPKVKYGGSLITGNYTCHQSVWNGPNRSHAYSFQYKGYFALKADGTYRWLDNGETGKYKYDVKTGTITWLSGYFKTSDVKLTQYQINKETAQMTVNFSDSYRWECGCKKK